MSARAHDSRYHSNPNSSADGPSARRGGHDSRLDGSNGTRSGMGGQNSRSESGTFSSADEDPIIGQRSAARRAGQRTTPRRAVIL